MREELYKKELFDICCDIAYTQVLRERLKLKITYKKLAGKDKKNKIVDEFKVLYKRKPVFMDELSKIK